MKIPKHKQWEYLNPESSSTADDVEIVPVSPEFQAFLDKRWDGIIGRTQLSMQDMGMEDLDG